MHYFLMRIVFGTLLVAFWALTALKMAIQARTKNDGV